MISSNHIFLSSSQSMVEICKPLKTYGINYFSYTKNYRSGKRVYLTTNPSIKLTDRQIDCIKLMLEGKTAKMIGTVLNLSPRTIEAYIHHLKRKLLCRNKSELIAKFIQMNLGSR